MPEIEEQQKMSLDTYIVDLGKRFCEYALKGLTVQAPNVSIA